MVELIQFVAFDWAASRHLKLFFWCDVIHSKNLGKRWWTLDDFSMQEEFFVIILRTNSPNLLSCLKNWATCAFNTSDVEYNSPKMHCNANCWLIHLYPVGLKTRSVSLITTSVKLSIREIIKVDLFLGWGVVRAFSVTENHHTIHPKK